MNFDDNEAGRQVSALDIRRKAMDLLARREHSQKELRQKLMQKGFPLDAVEGVLQVLEEDDLLSDERFAEAYVYMRHNRGYGPLRIQAELRERGISSQLIEQYLFQGAFDWYAQAEQVFQKRFGSVAPDDIKEKQRCVRFMQYRGFSSEHIRTCLDE